MVRNDLEAVSEPCDLRARVTAHSRGIQDSGSSLRDRFSLFQFHKVIHVYEKERERERENIVTMISVAI